MKIQFVIEDEKGKNILFITDSGYPLSVEEAINATQNESLQNTHIVNSEISFIRSNPNKTEQDNLDTLILSYSQLEHGLKSYDSIKDIPAIQEFEKIRMENIKADYSNYIIVDSIPRKTKAQVIYHLNKYKSIILKAAAAQNIDPATLGAILVDEYLRMGLDDWFDWAALIGLNTSIGIAQIKTKTAKHLIKSGLYNPNPEDPELEPDNIDKASKAYLYNYLKEPVHSANLAAAKIRYDINRWTPFSDISNRPDILGTLYSQGDIDVHDNPKPDTNRGTQIGTEFYTLAKDIFK